MLWSVNQPILEKAIKKWERQTGHRIEVVESSSSKVQANRYGFKNPGGRQPLRRPLRRGVPPARTPGGPPPQGATGPGGPPPGATRSREDAAFGGVAPRPREPVPVRRQPPMGSCQNVTDAVNAPQSRQTRPTQPPPRSPVYEEPAPKKKPPTGSLPSIADALGGVGNKKK